VLFEKKKQQPQAQKVCFAALQVNLSATPPWPWPGDMASWPTQPACNGSAIIATAFRADQVPLGFLVPKSSATRMMLTQPVSPGTGADPQLAAYFNASTWQLHAHFNRSKDYFVPGHNLLKFAEKDPNGTLKWPTKAGSNPAPYRPACATDSIGRSITADCYNRTVWYNLQHNSAIIPPANDTKHKECGKCGSMLYVYIYNCYSTPGSDLLVHVNLSKPVSVAKADLCYTRRDQVANYLMAIAVFFMAALAAAFLLPLGVSIAWKLLKQCGKVDGTAENM
jgi:hypothetical protein